jgi:hypothetical protein
MLDIFGSLYRQKLRESPAAYRGILRPENAVIRPQNQYFWEDIRSISK